MNVDVVDVAGLAARAELGWSDPTGRLHAIAIVPLVIDGAVVAALPFDHALQARLLADAGPATLVFSDSRMGWRGWTPCAVAVQVDVTADRDGEWTWTGALDQEVRKYPPSRLLIDTAIQRREHWWYVPRWIVRLRAVGEPFAVARRAGPDDGVLFRRAADRVTARCVAVDDWDAAVMELTALDAAGGAVGGAPGPDGESLLFTHDFSIPDQERSCAFRVWLRQGDGGLTVTRRDGARELGAHASLFQRVSRHYRLGRACRLALAAYDADESPAAAT